MREVKQGKRGIPQTVVDRLVAWWDPVRGAQRLRARAVMSMAAEAYQGASSSRRSLAGWNTPGDSADAALNPELGELRKRSHDLLRNNPLAAGAVHTTCTRVIGTGLALQPAIDHEAVGLSEERAAAWQKVTRRRWCAWAESTWCDAARRQNFYQLQSIALRGALAGGDAFALLPIMPAEMNRPNQLAIKLLEAERVMNPHGQRDRPDMTAGVRMDQNGQHIAYYVLRQHPGSLYGVTLEGDWIDAVGVQSGRQNVLHIMEPRRIGQTRGEPYLAPVIETLKQLGRYTDAEIMAAVVSSFFTVFTTGTSEGLDPLESAATGQQPASDSRKGASWNGELSSGLIVDLPAGADIKFANPSRPNQAFDPFVLAVLRQVGVALELPFELLIKHFTSSFTAARASLLDAWLMVRRRREWMVAVFCQPVYEEWLRIEIATGQIAAPGFFTDPMIRAAWCAADWTGDAMGVLNPQQEVKAALEAIDGGLTTLERETMALNGTVWSDVHAQRVRENNARKAAGLLPEPKAAPTSGAAPSALRADQPQADDDDDDTET